MSYGVPTSIGHGRNYTDDDFSVDVLLSDVHEREAQIARLIAMGKPVREKHYTRLAEIKASIARRAGKTHLVMQHGKVSRIAQ
jgi:hypothetical protein